jgi:hypothetical protein
VDVANVEAVEGRAVGTRGGTAFGGASSAILLSFGELRNDGDTLEFLTSQFERLGYGVFVLELNITDTENRLAQVLHMRGACITLWIGL